MKKVITLTLCLALLFGKPVRYDPVDVLLGEGLFPVLGVDISIHDISSILTPGVG